jgi:hypothetical protein
MKEINEVIVGISIINIQNKYQYSGKKDHYPGIKIPHSG